jgi:alpha-amylase
LTVTVNPERGGTITELAWLARPIDLADVLTRRPELYHDRLRGAQSGAPTIDAAGGPTAAKEIGLAARLDYDDVRRASLADGWFDATAELDAVAPWRRARWVGTAERLAATLEDRDGGLDIRMRIGLTDPDVRIDKHVRVSRATVEARYHIRSASGRPLDGVFATQWNLALTAGHAADRYFVLPGRPMLGSAGRECLDGLTLVDEWAGVEVRVEATPATEIGWGPVETVSVSEGGFERIFQGTALLIAWRFDTGATEAEVVTQLAVANR